MRRRSFIAGGAAIAASGLARPSLGATTSVIRFVPQADLSSIDPVWTTATVAFNHGMLVYDTLYGIDQSQTPKPQMVAGHDISSDNLTWTFTLRDGLLFHDGEPVRAIDCVASIQRWAKRKGFGQQLMTVTAEIKPLDDKRFAIRLTKPFPLMTYALGGADICPIMPQRSAEIDPFKQITESVGSGPFRFLPNERVSGSFAAYAKFDRYVPRQEPPSYWSGGKVANVDRVEWHVNPDFSSAANALVRNEVDWVESPLFDLLPMLRKSPGVQLINIDVLGAPSVLALNHVQPPFDNPKLRQAILPAIDQTEYMTALVGDQTSMMKVPVGVFTLDTPMASTTDMRVFTGERDVALAKKLVAESGYKGEKVLLMSPSDQAVLVPMAQVTQSVFQEIGLNVDFQSMDWGTLVGRRALDKPASEGGWNAFCTSWGGINLSNPGSNFPLRGNGKNGWFGWPTSPALESLRDQWFSAPDRAAQKAICDKMQSIAFQEVPFIPLGEYYLPAAMRTSLTNVVHAGNTCFWGVKKA